MFDKYFCNIYADFCIRFKNRVTILTKYVFYFLDEAYQAFYNRKSNINK